MWLTLVSIALLAIFAGLGAVRGAFTTGMGLASLLVAYAAAVWGAPGLAPAIQSRLDAPAWAALPLAGSLCFISAYAAMLFATSLLRRLAERHDDEARSPRDRFLGAVFGTVRGGLLALLLGVLALWIDALRVTGSELPIPAVEGSAAAAVTSAVVEKGLSAALAGAGPGGRVVARIAARPALALGELQALLEDPSVERLRGDALFWSYVERDNVDAALDRGSFQRMARDPELRGRLVGLGLITPEAADDPGEFRSEVGAVLREVGPRLRGLRNDPELHALLEDPQVVAMLQSGDTIGLLRHPGFRELVDRVTARPVDAGPPPR